MTLLILVIILILSCFGMAALLCVKHFELSTGHFILTPIRPALARAAARVENVVRAAPSLFADFARLLVHVMRRAALAALARLIIATERLLERGLELLRHSFGPARANSGEPSSFLREIAEQKRKLTRTARSRRAARETPSDPPVA
ncbi:MAG: hypothetical protein ACREGH_03910 [Minisyncoccia bacterium]